MAYTLACTVYLQTVSRQPAVFSVYAQLNSTLFIILQPKGWIKKHTIILQKNT